MFETPRAVAALDATLTDVADEPVAGLCCGTPGTVDALVEIDATLGTERTATLRSQTTELLPKLAGSTAFSTLGASLFTGVGGLAFAMLRAARPSQVASLLWFD